MEKKQIKLADIECVDNRKMEGIEELAANIAAVGLLQPVILTPVAENGKYRVVDGRRRFRALEHLKREALEFDQYVIWTGDQYQEAEAAFCANFARQNLTLAEEVDALRNIADTNEGVAKLLGKTPAWVALRRNLANLTGQWAEVLKNPAEFPQWTVAKLEIIAREPAEVQKEFENDIDDSYSLAELKDYFADAHQQISGFLFDTSECKECLKRSDAQGLLFADDDLKGACCLDQTCFVRKSIELVRQRIREDGISYFVRGDGWYGDEDYQLVRELKAAYPYEFKLMNKPKKGEKPNAVVVCGEGIGEYRVVVPRGKNAAGAAPKPASAGEKVKTEKSVAEREVDLAKKRNKLALQKLKEHLEDHTTPDTVEAWMQRGHYDDQKAHESFLKLVMWYGLYTCHGAWGDGWDRPIWSDKKDFGDKVLRHARQCMRNILYTELGKTLEHISMDAGPGICGLLFLDWGEYMKAAEAEIPEPKSLQVARIKEQQAKTAAEKGGAKK